MNNLLYSRNTRPFGYSFEEWTIRWWLWILGIPKAANPTYDYEGRKSHEHQVDPNVFFLCQTVEGAGITPCRTVTLAAGRSIFMPIINWLSISQIDGQNDEQLQRVAEEKIDEVANLSLTINGVPIKGTREELRVTSPTFEATLPEDNIFDVLPGPRRLVSDGYWVFLKPLPNSSILTTFGSCSSGVTRIGVSYNVNIIQ